MIRKLGSGARRKVEKVQWRSSDKRPVAWAGAGSSVVEIQMTQLLKFIERLSEGHKNICIDMRSRLGINWQPNFHPFWIFWPELFWLLLWLFTASVTLYWAGAVQSLNSLNISFAEILMPDKEVELLSPFFLFLCFKSWICNVKNEDCCIHSKSCQNMWTDLRRMLMGSYMNILWSSAGNLVQSSDIKILRYSPALL